MSDIGYLFKKGLMSKWYALVVLLLISGWIHLAGISVDNIGHVQISHSAILIQLIVYLLAGIGVVCCLSDSVKIVTESRLFCFFIVFCCASLLWSHDVYFTATRLVGMIGGIVIALHLSLRFNVTAFLRWLVIAFVILSLGNYLFIYFSPEIATRSNQAWKGFFINENQLGLTVSLFWILGSLLVERDQKYTLTLFVFAIILTAPLVCYSHSMMAYFVLVVSVLVILFLLAYYQYSFSLDWFWFVLFTLSIVGYFLGADIISFLGKRSSIGGRVVIWELVYDQVKASPWFGYGYGSLAEADIYKVPCHLNDLKGVVEKMVPYYGHDSLAAQLDIKRIAGRYALHMKNGVHNGFLDILFWFGWVGFSVFVTFLVDHLRKIYILLKCKYDKSAVIFFTVYTVVFLLINLGESQILVRSGLIWIIFIYVVFKVNETYVEYCKSVTS